MNKAYRYRWHPRFNVYLIDDALLLNAELEQLILPLSQFPLMDKIDGVTDTLTIAQNARLAAKQATFFHYCQEFSKQGLLVDSSSKDSYQKGYRQNAIPATANIQVLSSCSDEYLQLWQSILPENPNLTFVLVDDFFTPGLTDLCQRLTSFMVLKITGEKLWLSPLFSQEHFYQFEQLIAQLNRNQPLRKLLAQRFDEPDQALPYCEYITRTGALKSKIQRLVSAQTGNDKSPLLTINIADGQLTSHRVNRYRRDIDFKTQLSSPVHLTSCSVEFNKDGGSRHIAPRQTVANLQSLVDPLCGPVAYLNELEAAKGHPVKIFKSGFYKYPGFGTNIFDQLQPCLGKGVSPVQSQASALGEAIERLAAQYQGDEPFVTAKQSNLDVRSLNYQDLTPYSETQYAAFADSHNPDSQLKQAAKIYQDENIHWLQTWSLTKQQAVYVPLTYGFANTPFEQEQFGRWQSNGSAAGNTLEEAVLQGLFELLERDAIAIWWYNRLPRPGYDLNNLDQDYLKRIHNTLSGEQDYWLLNLTCDHSVPVMAAIGKHKTTGKFSFGFGCHLEPHLAAQRALTELCQLTPIREQNSANFDFNAIADQAYLYPDEKAMSIEPSLQPSMDIKQDIDNIVGRLYQSGQETLVINYSRAHLPLYTAKVIVPGLCHIWPQLALERLYQLPLKLGWQQQANTESTINPQPLYI